MKDADDKHDFESVGADVGDTLQDILAASQAMLHQVDTPRQEQDTSSKPDGDQECERNAKRTTLARTSLVVTVKEQQSLCMIKDQYELRVETVSLDRNLLEVFRTTETRDVERADGGKVHRLTKTRGGKVHRSTETRLNIKQQYCLE